MKPSLDIIIVNRNSGKLLSECLSSIVSTDRNGFKLTRVCIVDDLSTDNSLEGLGSFKLPLRIIRNSERSGYGASCNIGASDCKGDYLLFLNTDIVLKNNSLNIPIHFLEKSENKQIAILGIKQLDQAGNIQRHCSRFPTASMFISKTLRLNKVLPSIFPGPMMLEWDHLETRQVDQVIGAVMFMRRSVFEQLGGYDERFFVYYEDLDLSLRTNYLGFKSVYLDTVGAFHLGNATARTAWQESIFFNLRSKIIYAFKHFNFLSALIVALNSLVLEPLLRILWSVARFSVKDVILYIKVALLLWINFPFVVINRPRINWPLR